jgi:hypothetical protein
MYMARTSSEKERQQSGTGPFGAGELYQKYLHIHVKKESGPGTRLNNPAQNYHQERGFSRIHPERIKKYTRIEPLKETDYRGMKTSAFHARNYLVDEKLQHNVRFFTPAAPVQHTGHAVLPCHSQPARATEPDADPGLSGRPSSDLWGEKNRYLRVCHGIFLTLFVPIFFIHLIFATYFRLHH